MVWGGPDRLAYHGVAPLADGDDPLTGRTPHQFDPSQGAVSHVAHGCLELCAICWLALASPTVLAEEVQTLKERLSDKASDAQRVDNCHVPAECRGDVPRPDCPGEPQTAAPSAGATPYSHRERR